MSDLERIAEAIRNATNIRGKPIVKLPYNPTVDDLCAAITAIADWGCGAEEMLWGEDL